jgi:hypothetical protein
MSAAFFPLACTVSLAKPHIAFPVAATNISRKGVMAALALFAASLALRPCWPLEWIPQLHGYQHFVPILVIPGQLLVLALWRWRDRDAWLLLLAATLPQRWFYDSFTLWLIPKTRRTILATVACSWIAGIWRWNHLPDSFAEVGRWTVLCIYLPMLVVVVRRAWLRESIKDALSPSTAQTAP